MTNWTEKELSDGPTIRHTLLAMITQTEVLSQVAAWWPDGGEAPGLFARDNVFANLVGRLCVNYFKTHKKAPGTDFKTVARKWAAKTNDQTTADTLSLFLEGLNADFKTWEANANPKYALQVAQDQFNRDRMSDLITQIGGLVSAGKQMEAVEAHARFREVDLKGDNGISPFTDPSALKAVFSESRMQPLFVYPQALRTFFADQFSRGKFVSFMGGEGSGKSWLLLDVGIRALIKHHRVAYFDMGDQDASEVMERLMVRAAGEPFRADSGKWPFVVKCPETLTVFWDQANRCPDYDVTFSKKVFKQSLSEHTAWSKLDEFQRKRIRSALPYFREWHYETGCGSVEMIRNKLKQQAASGWPADVVIIDYADIIKPPRGRKESRDEINDTWQQLRALSLELNVLVVTATQINRKGIESKDLPRMQHVGEEKRKLAHVSSMIGIKADDQDTDNQIIRMNQVKRRRGKRDTRTVWVAQCLGMGVPIVLSEYMKETKEDKK